MELLFDCIGDVCLDDILPNKYIALRKIMNTETPTYRDLMELRNCIHDMIHISDMSPSEIKIKLGIAYTDFGMYIKRCLGIRLKTNRSANLLTIKKSGRQLTDEKQAYMFACNFTFDPYSYLDIPGYDLLLEKGIYHRINNPLGVCRDHMVSKAYGWRNNIHPSVISSPYNCQFLLQKENIQKGTACCITLDQLLERIESNLYSVLVRLNHGLPKSQEHKDKISASVSKYMCITDGISNRKILKTLSVPDGFRRGLTRKVKMVGAVGLEPTT